MAQTNCREGSCSDHQNQSGHKQLLRWLPAVLVAILPKCPFCLMAYSGAVSLCSGTMLFPNSGTTASYITTGLAIIIVCSLLFNHKGRKTWFALGIALLGIAFLILGQFYFISELNYYFGGLLLFFGIWLNGSFLHYYKKFTSLLLPETKEI